MEATRTTRAAAGYRAGTGYRRCWNCEHFTLPGGAVAAPASTEARPPGVPGAVQGEAPGGPVEGGGRAGGEQPGSAGSTPPSDSGTTTCAALGGPVEPTAVCDRWVQMADKARKRTGFRSALRRHGGGFLWDDEPGRGGPAGGAPPAGI